MTLTNPLKTLLKFVKLSISRYTNLNLMGNQLDDIFNFLKLSPSLATSGQPTEPQLTLVKAAGYQVVINLAPPTAENALPNEKASVEALGMQYVPIPVKFDNPTLDDFDRFCKAMQDLQPKSVLVHCAANMRVSAFMYLYRRIHEGWTDEAAKVDLQKIWTPNPVWQQFIQQVIENKL
jgi:protein tyrosine phosphatase (PTP) superfamily phosphohydrolase (DUF442 family)